MPYEFDPEVAVAIEPLMKARAQVAPPAAHDIASRRARSAAFLPFLDRTPAPRDVETRIYTAKTTDGHDLKMTWFAKRSSGQQTPGPAILHFHGGGMIVGRVRDFSNNLSRLVSMSSTPVLSVDYRLAPEHPHPTPSSDCYTGLLWLRSHAAALFIDPSRIAVMGESAGGGLAVAVALLARDRHLDPPLAKQILIYPMLDDRTLAPAERDLAPFLVWTPTDNLTGWTALLGHGVPGSENGVSPYAAPARAEDVSRLPSAFIEVGDLDIFLLEDLRYARRLLEAKVSVELHVRPGCPHAFGGIAPESQVGRRAMEDRARAMMSV